jgi:hypothetical protein
MTEKLQRTKFAIYDPTTKLFVSKKRGYLQNIWTDQFENIQSYAIPSNALEIQQWAKSMAPAAEIIELTITLEWTTAKSDFSIEDTSQFKKHKAFYDKFLPAVEKDVDSLSDADWKRFKNARYFLQRAKVIP